MKAEKLIDYSDNAIPVIAALPYLISVDENEAKDERVYDPESQLTIDTMGRDYSTCREDDSIWSIFTTKADTKKDD